MLYAVILIFRPLCDLCQEKKTKQLSVIYLFVLKQATIQVTLPFVSVPKSSVKGKKNPFEICWKIQHKEFAFQPGIS